MGMGRREFLRGALAGAALAGGSGLLPACAQGEVIRRVGGAKPYPMPFRLLGRTGLRVSAVSFGAMQCGDPEVIRDAVERGVNYIDTADCYLGGQNEKVIGEALSGFKGKVHLASKVHLADERTMVASVENSLRSLRVETIDVMQVHGVSGGEEVRHEEARKAFTRLKKEGKVRFAGVTTHGGQEAVLEAVAADGFYDVVLVACNFMVPPSLWEKVEAAAKKGVGIVAMKTQGGGFPGSPFPGLTPMQAALRAVLEKPGVACAVPGMYHRGMVDENLACFEGSPLATALLLDSYEKELAGRACAFCTTCRNTCPRGSGGMEAARLAMYLEGYRDPSLAKAASAGDRERVARCADCGSCSAHCPRGIDLAAAARRVVRALSG